MRTVLITAVLLLFSIGAARAEKVTLADDMMLDIVLPSERWQMSTEPPDSLVTRMVEHIHHDLESQGKEVSAAQVEEVARKRLASNELFVYSETGAHLEIDISAIDKGDAPPSRRTVKKSARYAGGSMESEEGMSDVDYRVRRTAIEGAKVCYRLDVDYREHGQPRHFIGLIGFENPYWLYFYYTDPLEDPVDRQQMEQILGSLKLSRGAGGY